MDSGKALMRIRYLGLRLLQTNTAGETNERLNGRNSNIAEAVAHGERGERGKA
jgi:hypothetical protein